MTEYLPVFVFLLAVLGFAGFSLMAPHFVGPHKKSVVKDMPYESGMDPIGDARKPLDVRFYLVAILFLIFDVELLLIFPYAVALRAVDGIPGAFRPIILSVMVFLLATVALAYVYAWRKDVFQWRRR